MWKYSWCEDDNFTLPCESAGTQFMGKHHNHITAGNLEISTNSKICKLFFLRCKVL